MMATARKPSGVKSESTGEATQIRKLAALNAALTARMDRLEQTLAHLVAGNVHNAQETFRG